MEKETIKMRKIISTNNAPKAIGPYSQAILSNNILYCSGQIAINAKTGKLETTNIKTETHRIMKNIGELLKAADMDFSNVLKCSIFMKDMSKYSEINEVYALYFKKKWPAREAIEVSKLPKSVNVEISVIAEK